MVSKGYRKRGCGVVLIKHVKNPILLAREMLIQGEADGGVAASGEQTPSLRGHDLRRNAVMKALTHWRDKIGGPTEFAGTGVALEKARSVFMSEEQMAALASHATDIRTKHDFVSVAESIGWRQEWIKGYAQPLADLIVDTVHDAQAMDIDSPVVQPEPIESMIPDDSDPSGGSGGAQGHCVLGGPTVEKLAEEWGLDMVPERYFFTKRRWNEHRRGLGKTDKQARIHSEFEWERRTGGGNEPDVDSLTEDQPRKLYEKAILRHSEEWDGHIYLPQGTVGCVVLDQNGTLCVATSTGGLTNKLSGRIGDTPTLGAGFWAEEWEESQPTFYKTPQPQSPLEKISQAVGGCLPRLSGYVEVPPMGHVRKRSKVTTTRAVAMSGTGNGDSFLRTVACRTAAAIARFAPQRSLASAMTKMAGPGGELQRSAGDRWHKTGEGEGGIIGIELVNGVGEVVYDFNCGGMFRTWIDEEDQLRVMVFKDEY